MIQRLIHHLRGNAVAYVALFVALGGTSYAAVSLPKDSVGTKQLRNGSVSAAKLASGVGGEVFAVTELNTAGGVIMSDPKNVKVKDWHTDSPGLVNTGGILYFPRPIPRACLPIATSGSFINTLGEDHLPVAAAVRAGRSGIQVGADSSAPIDVTIVCPR